MCAHPAGKPPPVKQLHILTNLPAPPSTRSDYIQKDYLLQRYTVEPINDVVPTPAGMVKIPGLGTLTYTALAAYTCVPVYVCAFSVGAGPIPWLLYNEIFPTRVRACEPPTAPRCCLLPPSQLSNLTKMLLVASLPALPPRAASSSRPFASTLQLPPKLKRLRHGWDGCLRFVPSYSTTLQCTSSHTTPVSDSKTPSPLHAH